MKKLSIEVLEEKILKLLDEINPENKVAFKSNHKNNNIKNNKSFNVNTKGHNSQPIVRRIGG